MLFTRLPFPRGWGGWSRDTGGGGGGGGLGQDHVAQYLLILHCEMYVNLPSYKIMEFLQIASGLWVVLKEKSMEIIKIASTSGLPRFVFSFEVIAFYYAFSSPCKYLVRARA